jgi:hypothetical protein
MIVFRYDMEMGIPDWTGLTWGRGVDVNTRSIILSYLISIYHISTCKTRLLLAAQRQGISLSVHYEIDIRSAAGYPASHRQYGERWASFSSPTATAHES